MIFLLLPLRRTRPRVIFCVEIFGICVGACVGVFVYVGVIWIGACVCVCDCVGVCVCVCVGVGIFWICACVGYASE